jgi:hypothetical protein
MSLAKLIGVKHEIIEPAYAERSGADPTQEAATGESAVTIYTDIDASLASFRHDPLTRRTNFEHRTRNFEFRGFIPSSFDIPCSIFNICLFFRFPSQGFIAS